MKFLLLFHRNIGYANTPVLRHSTLPVLLILSMFGALKVADCVWNVMAHAQKPDFVFRQNGRVHLNRRGRQFSRLLAAAVCASVVVMLDTPCSAVVWRVLVTPSGFGGLVVSVLASGTQDRGFKPGRSRRIFRAKKSSAGRGSKATCPMSQICGMLETPGNYVEVGFPGQICQSFLAHFRSSLPEGSHVAWHGAPLGSTGGTKGGAQRAC